MLRLTRRKDEWIELEMDGTIVRLLIKDVGKGRTTLVFDAPAAVRILRGELTGRQWPRRAAV